jgi:DNA-binding transcriptional ArsR family regulator
MENTDAVAALAALAQDNRLDVFRLLVQAGPEGMPAGHVAEALDLAPNTLTFHFDRLRQAGACHRAARGPFDDLCGTVRDDERAARLPH